MNNIDIKVTSSIQNAIKPIATLKSGMVGLFSTVDKGLGSWYNKQKQINMQLSNITKDANRASSSMLGFGKSLKQFVGVGAIYGIANEMAKITNSTIAMIETTNLFNVAMGDMAVETNKTVTAMSKLYGFDPSNLQSSIGTFNLLARSMGINSSNAQILSTNTSKLAVDLSSLTNVPINQVMQDLRSGLVGQSETVYKYGIDVTEAGLKTEALAQGISKSVRNMTQGEKMALRYATMIRQTTLAQGDFARTINTPANQLKVLSERFITLSRTIGSVFLPALGQILPYVNAIIIVLTRLFASLAKMMGVELPQVVDTKNSIGGIGDEAENSANSIDKMGKAIKDATLGIDELNVMPKPSGAGEEDTGGGALDFKLPEVNNLMDTINEKAQELADRLETPFKNILKLCGLIGASILGWKVSNALYALFSGKTLAPLMASIAVLSSAFLNPSGKTNKIAWLDKSLYVAPLAMITAIAVTIGVMIARFAQLYEKNEAFRNGIKVLDSVFKSFIGWVTGTAIPEIGKFLGKFDFLKPIGNILKSLNLDFGDIMITLVGIGLLFTPFGMFGVALLVFEGLTIAVRALGEAFSPAIEQSTIFGEGISKATQEKVQPFIDKINELDTVFDNISFTGKIIDDATVTDVKTKVGEIKKVIIDELSSDKNEDLANLGTLKKSLGETAFLELTNATNKFYNDTIANVTNNEKRINEIMATARKENRTLTESENTEILKLESQMQDTGIKQLSANTIEYTTIMRNLKDNTVALSVEQASGILKQSLLTKDGTIADAEKQYSEIELQAKRMLDVGAINQTQYDAIMTSAKTTKDNTIADANTQYQTILDTTKEKLGETSKYIDTETGEIKTKWSVFWDDMGKKVSTFATDYKEDWLDSWDTVKTTCKNLKTDVGTLWNTFWDGMKLTVKGSVNVVLTGVETFTNGIIDGLNWMIEKIKKLVGYANKALTALGKDPIEFTGAKLDHIVIPRLARGGILDDGNAFIAGELGKAEAIGSYQGKTTVMPLENTDFVDAIYKAVKSAMSEVDLSGQVIENTITLDGEKLYTNQQKVQRNRGVDFGMGVFAR